MLRKEITARDINEILSFVAQLMYTEAEMRELQGSQLQQRQEDFPFIRALLLDTPEEVVEIFHAGSLEWDLERVAGVWQWHVFADDKDNLHMQIYKGKPAREKTEWDLKEERLLNGQVAEYLRTHSGGWDP
jgi:hypothetical protein